jgi:ribonucleotide reductase alpha subunit
MGVMGLQNALTATLPSHLMLQSNFNDEVMEAIVYYAYGVSSAICRCRRSATYSSYEGSKWEQGTPPAGYRRSRGRARAAISMFRVAENGLVSRP